MNLNMKARLIKAWKEFNESKDNKNNRKALRFLKNRLLYSIVKALKKLRVKKLMK